MQRSQLGLNACEACAEKARLLDQIVFRRLRRAWPPAPCPPSTGCSPHQSSSAQARPLSTRACVCLRCHR